MNNAQEKSQHILNELTTKYGVEEQLTAEPLFLPSCGLMGDNKVYGYAWAVNGIKRFDTETWQGLLKDAGTRLTNEVCADDGERFVRVFAEITLDDEGFL